MLKRVFIPIHRAGWPIIGMFIAASIGLAFVAAPLGLVGAVISLWCVYFFRDPDRVTPERDGLVISSADGVVQTVDSASPPPELGMGSEPRNRVAIFMNIFDVHVNRIPCDGTITAIHYRPGKFFNASLDKASEFNERKGMRITLGDGRNLACVQIAGLIARRIRSEVREDQPVRAGERFGLIRFGSRVDIYLPEDVVPLVCSGQRSVAGETVVADLRTQESGRIGVVR